MKKRNRSVLFGIASAIVVAVLATVVSQPITSYLFPAPKPLLVPELVIAPRVTPGGLSRVNSSFYLWTVGPNPSGLNLTVVVFNEGNASAKNVGVDIVRYEDVRTTVVTTSTVIQTTTCQPQSNSTGKFAICTTLSVSTSSSGSDSIVRSENGRFTDVIPVDTGAYFGYPFSLNPGNLFTGPYPRIDVEATCQGVTTQIHVLIED